MALLIRWSKIKIKDCVSGKDFEKAKKSAENHNAGKLMIAFTEANPEWVLLYDHARLGQIDPRLMKFMRRNDLKFLAGHTFPHPALTQPKSKTEQMVTTSLVVTATDRKWDEVTKLQGNATRAKMELERRNFVWASVLAVMGAILGGLLSGQLLNVVVR